jgi:hypothetical protein
MKWSRSFCEGKIAVVFWKADRLDSYMVTLLQVLGREIPFFWLSLRIIILN